MSESPIVVGVDGSPQSVAALSWALDEADLRNCPVEAVTAWQPDMQSLGAMGIPPYPVEELHDTYADLLATAVAEATKGRDTQVTQTLVEATATEALEHAAQHATMLVLGSHGHGRIFESLLGSVSTHCVRHVRCPVVIIPAKALES